MHTVLSSPVRSLPLPDGLLLYRMADLNTELARLSLDAQELNLELKSHPAPDKAETIAIRAQLSALSNHITAVQNRIAQGTALSRISLTTQQTHSLKTNHTQHAQLPLSCSLLPPLSACTPTAVERIRRCPAQSFAGLLSLQAAPLISTFSAPPHAASPSISASQLHPKHPT
jgi:hypothetical protein